MAIAVILEGKGRQVLSIAADATVRQAIALLAEHRIGALPVLRDSSLAGIISERDVIYCLASDGAAILDWPVERLMTSPAITVSPDQEVLSGLSLMTRRRIRHLPVVEGDDMIGIVSIGDLVKHRMDEIEQEAELLRAYITSA